MMSDFKCLLKELKFLVSFRFSSKSFHSFIALYLKLLCPEPVLQQPLAHIFQTLFQHEVFLITPTLNAGLRHVCHGNTIHCVQNGKNKL
jgi:hypothetical protein